MYDKNLPPIPDLKSLFTPTELKSLLKASNFRGFLAVATTWGMNFSALLIMGYWPNPVTLVMGTIILGGRHLALAILMHEASHSSLFASRKLNDWIGQWICSYPTWQDLKRYRVLHLRHHQHTGEEIDPDLNLIQAFPVDRKSFRRKIIRDLLGLSGLKRMVGLLMMDLEFIEYSTSGAVKKIQRDQMWKIFKTGVRNLHGVIITNLILFLFLSALGIGWTYGIWILAYLSPFSVFVRLRSIAEHACTPHPLHPLLNTRTTKANFLARVTVAPHFVNYHLEHHLLMKAPYFQLPHIHRWLKDKKVLDQACVCEGYGEVWKLATNQAD